MMMTVSPIAMTISLSTKIWLPCQRSKKTIVAITIPDRIEDTRHPQKRVPVRRVMVSGATLYLSKVESPNEGMTPVRS